MKKNSFLTALLVCVAMLGAKAQNKNMYKADTIVDAKGNIIVNVYSAQTVVDGNGNIITRDYDVTAFDEINLVLPATVNYTVADDYSCRVTLDENLFECYDIRMKGDRFSLKKDNEFNEINVKPTKFVIEISAPVIEEISIVGSGNFCFVTPFETDRLKIQTTGSGNAIFKEPVKIHDLEMRITGSGSMVFEKTATIYDFEMRIAGSGNLECEDLHAEHANLSIAGSGGMNIESGTVKSANISVSGTGSVEMRCELESMDYNISGWGKIYYYGDVKVKGTTMCGQIKRIDSENEKTNKKCCDEKQKKTKTQGTTF